MSTYEQRDNSGSIWNNDRKEKETHPDRTGKVMVGGVMYWISGWIKDSSKGKYLSLAFKPMEENGQEDQTQRQPARQPQAKGTTQKKFNSIPDDQEPELPF